MRCLPRPRSRGRSSTFLCPYQTSTWSRYDRASTRAPIRRLFTEYKFRSTWIRLPESTFTRSRLAEEMAVMGELPARRMESARRERVKVDSGSLIHVERDVYSVNSRLIGAQVEARMYL